MTVEEALEHVRAQPGWADALVCEYRRAAGLANADPRDPARHVEAMWEMRGFARPERAESTVRVPLVGWGAAAPTGLTRLGALVAHELARPRTRRRQVREAVAAVEIAERRARDFMYGQLKELCASHRLQRQRFTNAAEVMSGLVDEMRPVSSRLEPGVSRRGQAAVDGERPVSFAIDEARDWRFDFADFTARQRFGLVSVP